MGDVVLNLDEVMAFDCFGNYISPVVAHLSGTHSTPYVASNCILNGTGLGCHSTGASPWLMVDFGTYVPIARVVVVNRVACCQDRAGKLFQCTFRPDQALITCACP
jgi:hypothetical protein